MTLVVYKSVFLCERDQVNVSIWKRLTGREKSESSYVGEGGKLPSFEVTAVP
jgi:hypothetical protein